MLVLNSNHALANERPNHFKGLPAETLEQAIHNFSKYNKKLQTLLNGELTLDQMGEIHVLSYTLENALKKIDDEVDELKDTLEEVHKGSEDIDFKTVKESGKKYLDKAQKIIQ